MSHIYPFSDPAQFTYLTRSGAATLAVDRYSIAVEVLCVGHTLLNVDGNEPIVLAKNGTIWDDD
jgi:hypothetical protein